MYRKILSIISIFLLIAQIGWASPTGLNNIPTTDVVSDKTLVLQGWLTTGDDIRPNYMTGFKYGFFDKIELGLDSKVGFDDAGPISLQAKLKIFESDFGFSALLGTEGITLNEDIGDNIVPYFAISQDIKISQDVQLFRLHGGYGFQKDNFGIFYGIDRTFNIFDQELILRSDFKQVNDRDDLLISAGFLLTLPFNLVLESWLNIPTQDGADESVTIKLNYVIKL